MSNAIAIVGIACCYPDSRTPDELWENVLAQRRAFRRVPPERLRLEDYWSADRNAADCIYSSEAALIQGYEFDRARFRVAGNTFRSADQTHWLALDVAAQALDNAGFKDGEGLQRESVGVFLGNTLTGEFSRANNLRLRWPYVRRVVHAALADEGWSPQQCSDFSRRLEVAYKEPFPPFGEESLAGGLSNTIAGRICNHFDFKGGGYTVDGACASSLLAVANACSALDAGDLDAALAGGVDLSLDPFELVGFAKSGALATDRMRIYDRRSNGFWPGEGCGFVVLMRHADALIQRLPVRATIRGWGISSDGSGGITRPEIKGQLLALRRAYRRAGFDIETVAYFEGHGTGTAVGDATELEALARARQETDAVAAIGSIKANIGHTKAAAGIAGLIKTVYALDSGIVPPTTGCEEPHPELLRKPTTLRTLKKAEPWPNDLPRRAGVSAMGFGGINAHVVLEGLPFTTPSVMDNRQRALISSAQDSEIFLLGSSTTDDLLRQINHLERFADQLSEAELSDLAAQLESSLEHFEFRAAVVASSPSSLAEGLTKLRTIIAQKRTQLDNASGVFFSAGNEETRIGFLFPGQGSPSYVDGGSLCRRFRLVEEIYARAKLDRGENEAATDIAQPAIATSSLAALRILSELGITAHIAVGHSLGELTALCWAGALHDESLLRIARVRGRAMMQSSRTPGGMINIRASLADVTQLLNGNGLCIAAINSPVQTVVAGEVAALNQLIESAREKNFSVVRLPVSHAFHSTLVASAGPILAEHLATEKFRPLQRKVISTVTGKLLRPDTDLPHLLNQQITSPVRFLEAVTAAEAEKIGLWLEVGPGAVLSRIISEITNTPVISLDAGSDSLRGLLCAIAAAFALGHKVNHQSLFAGRFTKPFDLDWQPKFFVNPCELAPVLPAVRPLEPAVQTEEIADSAFLDDDTHSTTSETSILQLLTRLVTESVELPASAIDPESRLLTNLHLNSITVTKLIAEAARQLKLSGPISPADFVDASLREIAQTFAKQLTLSRDLQVSEDDKSPAGVDDWAQVFTVELVARKLSKRKLPNEAGCWHVFASPADEFAEMLRQKLAGLAVGNGILICLPLEFDETIAGQLLEAARLALAETTNARLVLVQRRITAAAFVRTLHLEAPRIITCIVNIPPSGVSQAEACDWVLAEAVNAEGHVEVHYDSDGRRYEPVVRPHPSFDEPGDLPLCSDDVLVVTGGGKGITAECALSLAKESGTYLVLVGKATPDSDAELAANLKRMNAEGIRFTYMSVDVTDAAQVRGMIARVEHEIGPVTGILHGAARNSPQLISKLDEESLRSTLAVKVGGVQNLLLAVDATKLKLLVTFGSIIARTGLPGEADYGLANEWLTFVTEEWKRSNPACLCLAVEWSIWSGTGMGARLGRADVLTQYGVTPIAPVNGVTMLARLLRKPPPSVSVVVMGRIRGLPAFKIERPPLPFLRFLEHPRVFYPRLELVIDAELSTSTDPYLEDHVFQGARLLPAVMGLEAMSQAAFALTEPAKIVSLEGVRFNHPVIVSAAKQLKIRLAALRTGPNRVDVVLRSEETAFQVDHFQATCCVDEQVLPQCDDAIPSTPIALNPDRDLYGSILFQDGRFRRVKNYRLLRATKCIAEISSDGNCEWFIHYLPPELVLGDPGAHDAYIHAIQSCIPHFTILPVGVARMSVQLAPSSGARFLSASEVSRDGNTFIYNLMVIDERGQVHECWEGLELRAVAVAGR